MLNFKKLYTDPPVIDAIEFADGVNVILGVKDESSQKTNGVGKSLAIEFLNFALLSKKSKSRVSLIPASVFPPETEICLDIELGGKDYTIKRSLENAEEPKLIHDKKATVFASLQDASAFLKTLLFANVEDKAPSFRAMLGPLMRDERSEFKSIISCYDTNDRVPDDYAPHLFLFGLDIDVYSAARSAINEIDELTKDIKKIKENVRLLRQKDIADARSDLNELESEAEEIERSIDSLENVAGYEVVKEDIIRLETQLEELRRKKALLSQRRARTNVIAEAPRVDSKEVGEFFTHISERLGDLIKRDLNEVYSFKDKIDEFQNQLIHDTRNVLSQDISKLSKQISAIDRQYSEKLKILDQQGNLKNLKQTYAAFKDISDEASQLKAFISRYDDLEKQKQEARTKKEAQLLQLQSDIFAARQTLVSFERTILNIHEYIQGNKKASFEIKQTSRKQVVEIVMRIDDDGSHSVEREKVFIYDVALLLNRDTSARHPGILVHDNIFDVDQDTLERSIRYLVEKAEFSEGMQYILTLNSDRLGSEIRDLISPCVRAEFTKARRFLKTHYQEER